jgi:hypothetical protein
LPQFKEVFSGCTLMFQSLGNAVQGVRSLMRCIKPRADNFSISTVSGRIQGSGFVELSADTTNQADTTSCSTVMSNGAPGYGGLSLRIFICVQNVTYQWHTLAVSLTKHKELLRSSGVGSQTVSRPSWRELQIPGGWFGTHAGPPCASAGLLAGLAKTV